MYQVFIAVRVFLYIKGENIGTEVDGPKLDAYLEEELMILLSIVSKILRPMILKLKGNEQRKLEESCILTEV